MNPKEAVSRAQADLRTAVDACDQARGELESGSPLWDEQARLAARLAAKAAEGLTAAISPLRIELTPLPSYGPTCATCVYLDRTGSEAGFGLCRRFPPVSR